eukprot:m.24436 g.24436  ORF g.24436 m.24436 type:complete len:622 (+) comp7606_c0_seq1:171-2036(+)
MKIIFVWATIATITTSVHGQGCSSAPSITTTDCDVVVSVPASRHVKFTRNDEFSGTCIACTGDCPPGLAERGTQATSDGPCTICSNADTLTLSPDTPQCSGARSVSLFDLEDTVMTNEASIAEMKREVERLAEDLDESLEETLQTQGKQLQNISEFIKEQKTATDKELESLEMNLGKEIESTTKAIMECQADGKVLGNESCVQPPTTRIAFGTAAAEDCQTADDDGKVLYDKKRKALYLCNAEEKSWVGFSPAKLGSSEVNPASSCKAILEAKESTGSHLYWLLIDKKPALRYCDMFKGVSTGNGETKDESANSCAEIQAHYGTLEEKGSLKWINNKQIKCSLKLGVPITHGDGSSLTFAAVSCQDALDNYKIKTGVYYIQITGGAVQRGCTINANVATEIPLGKTAGEAAPGCKEIKAFDTDAKNGYYFLTVSKTTVQLFCDMEYKVGSTVTPAILLYAFHKDQASSNEWMITYNNVIGVGKNHGQQWTRGRGSYLLPIKYWPLFSGKTMYMTSQRTGTMIVRGFQMSAPQYKLNWASISGPSTSGLNYHKGYPLSAYDRDNDVWGSNCANYARTFGWYRSCCNLCMTTNPSGSWGRGPAMWPSDWSYRYSQYLEFRIVL